MPPLSSSLLFSVSCLFLPVLSFPGADVVVESVHFSDSLLALSYMISQQEKAEKAPEEEPQ